MKKMICWGIAMLISSIGFAQNLVANGNFEEYNNCETSPDTTPAFDTLTFNPSYPTAKYWLSPNSCTPDYFRRGCDSEFNRFNAPANFAGYQLPHSGEAYIGITPYATGLSTNTIFREYIQTKLISPLEKDALYCLHFFISSALMNVESLYNYNAVIIDHIDIALSTQRIVKHNNVDKYDYGYDGRIDTQDYIPIGQGIWATDTARWYELKTLYRAKGGEEWLTIGNFKTNEDTNLQILFPATTTPVGNLCYTYIDDVSVERVSEPIFTSRDSTVCAFPVPLQAAAGFNSYLWNTGETTQSIIAPQAGDYWVKVTMDECGSVTDTITLRPFVPPVLSLADATICADALPVTVTANGGFSGYLWSDGSTAQSLSLSQSGSYTLTATHQCGTVTDNMAVNILPLVPAFSLGTSPIDICEDGTQTPTVLRPDHALPNYQWNTGATTSSIAVAEAGIYSLVSENDCNTERAEIEVVGCPATLYFPNAFTPNNDGHNDIYLPFGKNVTFLSLQIFDRWGELIYEETGNNLRGWDGTFQGKPLDTGVFVYLCRYQSDVSDKIDFAKGDITLIK